MNSIKKFVFILFISLCSVNSAFASFSLPSPLKVVEDIYESAKSLPGGIIDFGAWAVQSLVVEPVLSSPEVLIGKFVVSSVLPDRYDRMLDRAFNNMDVRKALPKSSNRGTNLDLIDIIKSTTRENQIFSRARYYAYNDSYINEQLNFEISRPGEVYVKISAPRKEKIIGEPIYTPLFYMYPIEVEVYSMDNRLVYSQHAKANFEGNISLKFYFTENILEEFGESFKVKFLRQVSKFGDRKSVVVTTTVLVPRPLPQYRITLVTSGDKKAGTDSRVWITVLGSKNDLIDYRLDDNHDNFEKKRKDVFLVKSLDLGQIRTVQVHTDNSNDGSWWKLSTIKIEKINSYGNPIESRNYLVNKWIGGRTDLYSSDQSLLDRDQSVCVKTGAAKYAGTDATITVRLWAENGKMYGPVELDAKGDDFEKNSYKCYKIKMPLYGKIEKVQFFNELNGKGAGWYLNYAKVITFDRNGNEYNRTFPINSWLDETNNGFAESQSHSY